MPLPSWPSGHHKGKGTLTTASAEDVFKDWSGLFIPLRKAEAEGGRVPDSLLTDADACLQALHGVQCLYCSFLTESIIKMKKSERAVQ